MSNSKYIHDYLDGELNKTQQDILFADLANNSELRDEFNQQLKLHMIAKSDMSMIAPPAAVTNSIFGQLGFSMPPSAGISPAAVTSAGSGIASSLLLFFKRHAANSLTALLSAVLTGLIIYFLIDLNYGNNSGISGNQQTSNYPIVSSLNQSPVTVIPSASNALTEDDVNRIINKAMAKYSSNVDRHYRELYAAFLENNNSGQSDNTNVANQPNVIYVPYDKYYTTTPLIQNNNDSPVLTKTVNSNPQITNTAMIEPQLGYDTDFTVYLRGYSAKSNVNVAVPSQSNPWFVNMALGAGYNISSDHRIGLEIGQEAYPQVFTRDSWGEELTFYQNPVLLWYGATYRFSMTDFLVPNVLYPYAQIMGGFTKVGPVGRAQIGLNYSPDKRVSFNLGVESSALWYNVDKVIYDTKKFGFTYGVSINY